VKKERIFLDANVLFSVAYGSKGLEHLWVLQKKGICVLLASRYVIEEAKRNLTTPEQLKKLKSLLSDIQIVPEADPSLTLPIDLPEKDKPVLLSAISTKADYLLTGDMRHFGKYYGQTIIGVKIILPRNYLLPKTCLT